LIERAAIVQVEIEEEKRRGIGQKGDDRSTAVI